MKHKDWQTNLDTARSSLRAQEEILEQLRREAEDGEDPYLSVSELMTRWQFLRTHFRKTQLTLMREADRMPSLNDYQQRRVMDSLELQARQLDSRLSAILGSLERREGKHCVSA
ncbi:hypothetical protein [Thiohalorhabdus methylotrophus]|uniref:Uncharacterized protein n=1 Tax=Thiohalorhabdus methylotrophus TaxID=3242694 RepID=A0ABV4TS02_9GAMM